MPNKVEHTLFNVFAEPLGLEKWEPRDPEQEERAKRLAALTSTPETFEAFKQEIEAWKNDKQLVVNSQALLSPSTVQKITNLMTELSLKGSFDEVYLKLISMCELEIRPKAEWDILSACVPDPSEILKYLGKHLSNPETFTIIENELLLPKIKDYRNDLIQSFLFGSLQRLNDETGLLIETLKKDYSVHEPSEFGDSRKLGLLHNLPDSAFKEWEDGVRSRLGERLKHEKAKALEGAGLTARNGAKSNDTALNEISGQKEPSIREKWPGSKKEFAVRVEEYYLAHQEDFRSLKEAAFDLFDRYEFKDANWTKERCYDYVRKV